MYGPLLEGLERLLEEVERVRVPVVDEVEELERKQARRVQLLAELRKHSDAPLEGETLQQVE